MPIKNNQRPDRAGNRKAGNSPELTAEQKRTQLAKELGLTNKQKAFVDKLLANTNLSATEAYMQIYGNSSRKAASVEASRTLAKPSVAIYKDSAVKKAKERIVSLVSSDNESIALKASQDIIDRTEGKAQQKDGDTSRTVRVEIDLTGVKLGNHYLTPAQIDGDI